MAASPVSLVYISGRGELSCGSRRRVYRKEVICRFYELGRVVTHLRCWTFSDYGYPALTGWANLWGASPRWASGGGWKRGGRRKAHSQEWLCHHKAEMPGFPTW